MTVVSPQPWRFGVEQGFRWQCMHLAEAVWDLFWVLANQKASRTTMIYAICIPQYSCSELGCTENPAVLKQLDGLFLYTRILP